MDHAPSDFLHYLSYGQEQDSTNEEEDSFLVSPILKSDRRTSSIMRSKDDIRAAREQLDMSCTSLGLGSLSSVPEEEEEEESSSQSKSSIEEEYSLRLNLERENEEDEDRTFFPYWNQFHVRCGVWWVRRLDCRIEC